MVATEVVREKSYLDTIRAKAAIISPVVVKASVVLATVTMILPFFPLPKFITPVIVF